MNSIELPSNVITHANEALISDVQKMTALGQWRNCRVFALMRIYFDAFPGVVNSSRSVSILALSTENSPFKMGQGTYFEDYIQNQSGGAKAKYIDGVLASVDVICSVNNYYHPNLFGGTVANSLVGLHRAFKISKVIGGSSFTKDVVVIHPFNSSQLCSYTDVENLLGPVFIYVPHSVTHEDPNVVNLVHQIRMSMSTYTASRDLPEGVVEYIPVEVDSANTTRADRIRDEAYRQCGVPLRSQ